jgi:hypothetical protein
LIPVDGGSLGLFNGDSITAGLWPEVAGGLIDRLNDQFPIVTKCRLSRSGGGARRSRPAAGGAFPSRCAPVSTRQHILTVNTAVAGNKTEDIALSVGPRITDHDPDWIVLLIGINDVINAIDPAVSEANVRSIMTQIRAWSATVPVLWLSLLLFGGELWAAGPPLSWGPNPPFLKDPAIDAFNVMLQAVCADFPGCTYNDMRAQLLAWESQNNTPEPGVQVGPFASGGPHPLIPSGQILMGQWGIGSFSVLT